MECFDVAVLGSGPVALLCALAAARTQRTILLARPPRPTASVEAVPAGLLGLLLEVGIHPVDVGAARVLRRRVVAWEDARPAIREAPPAVHVDRAAVARALFARASDAAALTVRVVMRPTVVVDGAGCHGPDFRAARLVDATGRAARSASRRTRPVTPWVATAWSFPTRESAPSPELAMAALPSGYAYRLGSRTALTLGIVSPGTPARTEATVRDALRAGRAEWIADGIPWERASRPTCRIASVQWTHDAVLRIGDAALARDALSSQGLAAGLSEALYAAAARSSHEIALFHRRQEEQRGAHLRALVSSLGACRFRREPVWGRYAEWLAAQAAPVEEARVGLRSGRVVCA